MAARRPLRNGRLTGDEAERLYEMLHLYDCVSKSRFAQCQRNGDVNVVVCCLRRSVFTPI